MYDQANCHMEITHTPSKTKMFAANPQFLVKGGHGNVDDEASNIIKDGDIHVWPKAKKFSNHVTQCPEVVMDDDSVSFAGTSVYEV